MASTLAITVAVHEVGSQRVAVFDCDGRTVAELDLPTGYVMVISPSPWWVRLRKWARLRWWLLRNG